MGDICILAIDLELVLRPLHFVQDQEHSRHSLLAIPNCCLRRRWTSWYTHVVDCTLSAPNETSQYAFRASNVVSTGDHDHAVRHYFRSNV